MENIQNSNFSIVNNDSKQDKKKLSNYYSQVLNITITNQKTGFWYNVEKIIQNDQNPQLFTTQNVNEKILVNLLNNSIQQYFKSHQEKIDYLFNVIQNCLDYNNRSKLYIDQGLNLMNHCSYNIIQIYLNQQNEEKDIYLDRFFECNKYYSEKAITVFYEYAWKYFPIEIKIFLDFMLEKLLTLVKTGTIYNIIPYQEAIIFLKKVIINQELNLKYCLEESYLIFNLKNNQKITNGQLLETQTILGCLLNMSYFPKESNAWQQLFKDELFYAITAYKINDVIKLAKKNIEIVIEGLFQFFNLILSKQNNIYNQIILDWIQFVIKCNFDKTKIYQNINNLSSNGFLMNFQKLIMKFWRENLKNNNNISKISQQIDILVVVQVFKDIQNNYESLIFSDQIKNLQNIPENQIIKNQYLSKLYALTMLTLQITQLVLKFDIYRPYSSDHSELIKSASQKYCCDIHFEDEECLQHIIKFFNLQGNFINILLCTEYNQISLLNINITQEYGLHPSIFIEYTKKIISFIYNQYEKIILENLTYLTEVLISLSLIASKKELISSMHNRAKVMSLFSVFIPEPEENSQDKKILQIFLNENLLKLMIESLIQCFIDAEKNGTNNQFYDKFNYRIYFSKTFNFLMITSYTGNFRKLLLEFVENQPKKILKLCNFLLNDIVYLIDEVLEKLKKIHNYENQDLQNQFLIMDEADEYYQGNRTYATIFSNFIHYYIQTIQVITKYTKQILLKPEIIDKLVSCINHIIFQFNNPNNAKIYEVNNFKELNLNKKIIISLILDIYIDLQDQDQFLIEVINDNRSYNEVIFDQTVIIQKKAYTLDIEKADRFQVVLEKLKIQKSKQIQKEQKLDKIAIPDEYIDPITGIIMKDPVKLPISEKIVDRMTINKILLNDQNDPFNRQPINENQLEDQIDLKIKIQKFLEENDLN